MSLTKPQRIRDPKYLAWILQQPCYAAWPLTIRLLGTELEACEGPMDAHHAREKGQGGIGTKPSDREAVPACRFHHELAEKHPDLFRELFQAMKRHLSSDYELLFSVRKAKKARSMSPRVQHLLILCECKKVHRIPEKKAVIFGDAKGILKVAFSCPIFGVSIAVFAP